MKYSLSCGDVIPGCPARFEATSADSLLGQVAAHAASAHGIEVITPEIRSAVEAKIVVTA